VEQEVVGERVTDSVVVLAVNTSDTITPATEALVVAMLDS